MTYIPAHYTATFGGGRCVSSSVTESNIASRESAARIAATLGDTIGNREALILSDPEVTVTRDADYPGCLKVRSRMHNNGFIYRTSDNAIVG